MNLITVRDGPVIHFWAKDGSELGHKALTKMQALRLAIDLLTAVFLADPQGD